MAGLLGGTFSKLGGLLGSPEMRQALLGAIGSRGDPRLMQRMIGDKERKKYMDQMMQQQELENQLRLMEYQKQMQAEQEMQQRGQFNQDWAQSMAGLSPEDQAKYQTPEAQGSLRNSFYTHGDPKSAIAGGLLSPVPEPVTPTSLMKNLEAAGLVPGSPEYNKAVMASVTKPQSTVNVNTGGPKLPAGKMWVDESDPSKGVVNIPGSEQAAEVKKTETAREGMSLILGDLRSKYDTLNSAGGITSTAKDISENIAATASGSAAGQALGKMSGSKNVAARQSIATMRPLLIQAIKNATGMTAQQMNSDRDIQMMLQAATDPSMGYEVNVEALNRLDQLYGSGAAGQPTIVPNSSPAQGGWGIKLKPGG